MRGGGLSDEAQMTECTHETLRLAPKTVTKTHEERLRPYALQVLLDAHADAWKRDLILKGDGLCLGHGVYSVDEDNPDGDCKACMAEASLTASQERVRDLEYLLDYAYYLRFIGEATNHDQELEYWGHVEAAIESMHGGWESPSLTA